MNEAYVDASGNLGDFSPPSKVIWSDDDELDIGSFVAYEKDGRRYAMYLDRQFEVPFRRVHIKEYDRNFVANVPENEYDTAAWIYEAHFLDTDNDFPYGKYSIVDLDEADLAKTMYVLMAGNDKFRAMSDEMDDVKNEKELDALLDSVGLSMKLVETIRKSGRRTWTVYSEKGRRLGSAGSLAAAKKRLRDVEMFKHMNEDFTAPDGTMWNEEAITGIAQAANIDLSPYHMTEIILGMPIELEHGSAAQPDANLTDDDPTDTLMIVLAHLKEFERYYSELLIPAEAQAKKKEGNMNEDKTHNQYVLKPADGEGFYSVDFTTKQPNFSKELDGSYVYSSDEADYLVKTLLDEYGISVDKVTYDDAKMADERVSAFEGYVPMFEEYSDDAMKKSDWYIGATGDLYASDGRAMRDFDFEKQENQPTEEEFDIIEPYMSVVRGSYKIFKNVTEPHKGNGLVAFGFAGPKIKNGPYAGSDSWWLLGRDAESGVITLHNETTDDSYEVSDSTEFRKLLASLVHDLYE